MLQDCDVGFTNVINLKAEAGNVRRQLCIRRYDLLQSIVKKNYWSLYGGWSRTSRIQFQNNQCWMEGSCAMVFARTVPQGGQALSQVTQFPSTLRCFMSHVIPFNKSFSALSRQSELVGLQPQPTTLTNVLGFFVFWDKQSTWPQCHKYTFAKK